MPLFEDIKTYSSYCFLLGECWNEIPQEEVCEERLKQLVGEFAGLIQREAKRCTVAEATEWCEMLEHTPFQEPMNGRWNGVFAKFTPRVRLALQETRAARLPAALEWIDFVDNRQGDVAENWKLDVLAPATGLEVTARLAQRAFEVATSVAKVGTLGLADAIRDLEQVAAKSKTNLWLQPFFREALWACLTTAPDRNQKISRCVNRLLGLAVEYPDTFQSWVRVCMCLEDLGVRFKPGDDAAQVA